MLVIRKSNITDLGFIYSHILYGAKKGHYSFDAENEEMVRWMKKEMQSVVVNSKLLDERYARAFIVILNNMRIGLFVLSQYTKNSSDVEIYAISIIKKYQSKGYGRGVIDEIINRSTHENIYAKCSVASNKMSDLLLNKGFKPIGTDENHSVFKREALSHKDISQPVALYY